MQQRFCRRVDHSQVKQYAVPIRNVPFFYHCPTKDSNSKAGVMFEQNAVSQVVMVTTGNRKYTL